MNDPVRTPDSPITWARPRVQNFSQEYARAFVHALASLDGEEFDKARFFQTLVDMDVVSDPKIPQGKTKEETYAKRWDSYLAPIRPFGLGFNVNEQREQSPNRPTKTWRLSPIARALDQGEIDHRSFMTLQLARSQFPKVTMPLKDPAKRELESGAAIQPLRLFIEIFDELSGSGDDAYLTHDEVCQLTRCRTHQDMPAVVTEIRRHRGGDEVEHWDVPEPPDLDILLNELHATRHFRRLPQVRAPDLPLLVLSHPRAQQLRSLVTKIDWIDVTTDEGIETYYERLMAVPSEDESAMQAREPDVLKLPPEVSGDEATRGKLSGPVEHLGGLFEGDLVFVSGTGRLLLVERAADVPVLRDETWQCTIDVSLVAFAGVPEVRADGTDQQK